jgi:hypothetical protein
MDHDSPPPKTIDPRAEPFDRRFPESNEWIKLSELADWLQIPHQSIVQMHRKRRFPRLWSSWGRCWRVQRSEARKWFLGCWDLTQDELAQKRCDDRARTWRRPRSERRSQVDQRAAN